MLRLCFRVDIRRHLDETTLGVQIETLEIESESDRASSGTSSICSISPHWRSELELSAESWTPVTPVGALCLYGDGAPVFTDTRQA